MLFYLLNSLLINVLLIDMFQRRYPEEFDQFIINLSFNFIYIFSRLQIITNRTINKLNKYIEDNPYLIKIKNEMNNILTQKQKNFEIQKSEYGFSILNVIENNIVNKKLIYDDNYEHSIEHSEIKFLLIEFYIGETDNNKYKIDLKTDKFNYYIVGNKFTKNFFIFYVKNHLIPNNNISDNDRCSLKIIDHNVNTIDVEFTDKNESITLHKNDYSI